MDNVDNEVTMSIVSRIPGGQPLIDWFHGRLEFGDAEVVELRLLRSGPSVLRIQAEISERGFYGGPPNKAALVSFMLRNVLEVAVQGFSHQNVIGGLRIRMAGPQQYHPTLVGIGLTTPDHEIELEPLAGAFGIIRATIEAIVVDAQPPSLGRP